MLFCERERFFLKKFISKVPLILIFSLFDILTHYRIYTSIYIYILLGYRKIKLNNIIKKLKKVIKFSTFVC
jgi:hypothetical protein